MTAPDQGRRAWLGWLAVVGTLFLVVVIRVGVSGSSSLEAGQTALASGDEVGATAHLRESVSWYLPWGPWRSVAMEDLWSLYEKQAARGDLPAAVRTLSALRSGVVAGQGLVRSDGEQLDRVHAVLPGLMARWEAQAAEEEGRRTPGPMAEREAHFSRLLDQDARPQRGWGLLAVLGFGLWIGGGIYATGKDGAERIRPLVASVGGLVLFLVGLGLA